MKKLNILTSLTIATIVTLAVGCSALTKATLKPEVTTTSVLTPATTNLTTGVVIPPVATQISTTNWVVQPTAQAVTSIIGGLPIPWAGTIGVGLGWLLTAFANYKNKKSAVSLIQGIEAVRTTLQTTTEGQALDAKIKAILIKYQEAAGVYDAVSKLVDQYTGYTTTTEPLITPTTTTKS
jgi:hypothetical protein